MVREEMRLNDEVLKHMKDRQDKLHGLVVEKYAEIARGQSGGCMPSCCDGSTSLVTIREMGMEEAIARAEEVVGDRPVYLSIDIDGIDPAYAPGVGTPEPFGITPLDVKILINHFAPRLAAFDLMEVSPPNDNGNTAALAARLVQEVIASVSKARNW